jgi:Fur family ferric uptake transcriptional regulator
VKVALDRVEGFRTAQDLHAELRGDGEKIGLSTVYRTLQTLAASGEVDALRNEDGEAIYRRCALDEHHHHIVCRSCGRATEIQHEGLERWAADIAKKHGFTEVTHTTEIHGTCRDCSG